jgi:DNA-binding NarL/FixJ family response regulator
MKILIADDSSIVRERLVDMVSELEGVEIAGQAANGLEAIDGVRRLKPDAVILDIQMPGENGIDVLAQIKKEKPAVTVIMLTNYPHPEFREKCTEAGADFFFDKSTQFGEVIEALRNWIQRQG